MLALEWLKNAHGIMEKLEATQLENNQKSSHCYGRFHRSRSLGPHVWLRPRNNSRRRNVSAYRQLCRIPPALRIASDILHADYRPDGYSSVPLPGTGQKATARKS